MFFTPASSARRGTVGECLAVSASPGIFSALAGATVGVVTLLAARRPGRRVDLGRATSAAAPM